MTLGSTDVVNSESCVVAADFDDPLVESKSPPMTPCTFRFVFTSSVIVHDDTPTPVHTSTFTAAPTDTSADVSTDAPLVVDTVA